MNSTASLQFLLDTQPASPTGPSPQNERRPSTEQSFHSHYQGSLQQQKSEPRKVDAPSQSVDKHKQTSGLQVKRVQQEEPSRVEKKTAQAVDPSARQDGGKAVPLDGESLPLPDEVRALLAGLDDKNAEQLLQGIQEWLQGLSDADLEKLQSLLASKDSGEWLELLSEDLESFLRDLALQLDMDVAELNQGIEQILLAVQRADVDFRQLAGLTLEARSTSDLDKGVTDLKVALRADTRATFAAAQQKVDAKEEQFKDLVSRLGRGDLSVLSSQRGQSEPVQQLMQSASQGLGSSLAAQSVTARMSPAMPPLLSQAIAQTNAEALASRISMMQGRGLQIAEMRLDPPELGKLRIQIRMQGDQATVVMQSPNAQARDLLENALPRLRELLEQQGIALADASVSEESFSGEGGEGGEDQGLAQGNGGAEAGESTEEVAMTYFDEPLGLIDYYA